MKKEYFQPQLECTEVTVGQSLCVVSPGGGSHGGENNGAGNAAPARTLYV